MNRRDTRSLDTLFDLGLGLKAIFGAIEILGSVAVLFVSRMFVLRIGDIVTQGELARDPDDFVATTIREAAHAFAIHSHYLLAAYLFLRGLSKVVLIILILRGVRVAYPIFIVVLGVFGAWEAYRSIDTHNFLLGATALFDTALIFLTAYEYKRRYPHHSSQV